MLPGNGWCEWDGDTQVNSCEDAAWNGMMNTD